MSSAEVAGGRRPRNPRGEGARLRAEIVVTAHELLGEAGEDAVTLRAIARRIGISAPSIYRHFDDRQAILLAVAQDAFGELARALRDAVEACADRAEQAEAVCGAYLDFAREHPRQYLVMFGGTWNAGRAVDAGAVNSEQVTELGSEALEIIAAALPDGRGTSAASGGGRSAAATVVWVGLHGLAHQRLVAPGFPWPPDIQQRLIATLIGDRGGPR